MSSQAKPSMSTTNNSGSQARHANSQAAEIHREIRLVAEHIQEAQQQMHDRVRRVRHPVYRDLNPVDQLLPPVCEDFVENGLVLDAIETHPAIALPEYFAFNSAETSTLLSMLLDSNHTRMTRLLNRVHIRSMLKDDRYYQILDDPQLYYRSKCTDLPSFHNRVVLYLTSPGLLIYLKQTHALSLLVRVHSKGVLPRTQRMINRREKRQPQQRQPQSDYASVLEHERIRANELMPYLNVYAFQYATYVHCYDGDILRFQLDYLMVKRDYQDGVPILLELGWQPKSPSMLLYRRQYYQYMTPFLDWVDMIRYQLRTSATISITGFYERLLDAGIGGVDIDDLKYFGRGMLECIELRRLTKANCKERQLRGFYAGRRIYRDKDPRCPAVFADAFNQRNGTIRPVLPHACSPLRRFLVHLNYYDRNDMRSLPQMLALVDSLLKMEFFAMHPILQSANIWHEPLVFQIYDFVWSMRQGSQAYLRNESWESIKSSEDAFAWYQRWDVFNCICLLVSILQNAIQREQDEAMIERLVHQLIDVLCSSKFLESFIAYSYFDVYLGLSSAVNCVPNLSITCLMRIAQSTPFHLAANLNPGEILSTFSDQFWLNETKSRGSDNKEAKKPSTILEISKFLINRSRRCCVQKVPIPDTIDSMSGMSAMGSTGAVTLFQRNYKAMPPVLPVEESIIVSQDHSHEKRRIFEERQHLTEYKRNETDYRYGQLFTDSYYMAKGRPRMFYHENLSYIECAALSMLPYTMSRAAKQLLKESSEK